MFGVFYIQSEYSLLNNIIPLKSLIENAKKGNYDFLALSDDYNLHGALTLTRECKKIGIKPVIGIKVKVLYENEETGFLLYAKNNEGYNNILDISREINTTNNPLTFDFLSKKSKNVIAVSSGADSIIDKNIKNANVEKAFDDINYFKTHLDILYIGLTLQSFEFEMKHASNLVRIAGELDVKVLPINKTSYLDSKDSKVLETLVKIENDKNQIENDVDLSFKTKKELLITYSDYLFVFENAKNLVNSITFDFNLGEFHMPKYPTPNKVSSKEYLSALAAVGLKKRLFKDKVDFKVYDQRLRYELEAIDKMEFNDYFLIVYDFISFAKKNNIVVGPGRGSAAGSLVSYSLGITDVDPIKYHLMFERFLNPERKSMPDIDTDFPDNRRDEVINYVKNKYGINHICSISTFSTFGYKQALRDIARVFRVDSTRLNGVIKRIENDDMDESDDLAVEIAHIAKKLEGLPRHIGTHAAGIILTEADLTKTIPLTKGGFDFYQSQLEASNLESLGLLKIDFLGIRNLTIIDKVIEKIPNFKLSEIPLDESRVYEMLSNGDTTGIFQLESSGVRNVLRKLKPKDFEDIVAVLALYRPGPMDNIDLYIERRNGKEYEFLHPDLKPILKNTYGILIYQEQIMQICVSFAGYSLAEADLFRRAVSKKDIDILESERLNFINKCIKKGYQESIAVLIYDYILKFANYGFNRSHSVAYALVAYQMSYLKTTRYNNFMEVLMSSVVGNETLTFDYIKEARKSNLFVTRPDINISNNEYVLHNDTLYFPLIGIKGLGKEMTSKILLERQNGIFKDYNDFKNRVAAFLNKKALEQLIFSGALDSLGLNRQTMMKHGELSRVNMGLYYDDLVFTELDEYETSDLISQEKQALGFNLMFNPLLIYKDIIESKACVSINDIKIGINKIIGYIEKKKEIKTKAQESMAFLTITDSVNSVELVAFPKMYKEMKNISTGIYIFTLKAEIINKKQSNILEKIEGVVK